MERKEGDAKKRSPWLRMTTRAVAYAAVSVAGVFVATLAGFGAGAFSFNLGDTLILLASALFGPVIGMIAGGLGSFLADLAVYPTTMLFTLVIKGVEGLICGLLLLLVRKTVQKPALIWLFSGLSMVFSTFLMAGGYYLCQSLFYGTAESALVALPMDLVQASVSFALAFILLFPLKLIRFREKKDKWFV